MIDFGKYTWTVISAYGGTISLILILVIQTLLKSKKILKELIFVEQERSIETKQNKFD